MVTIIEITKKKILFTISVYTLDCTLYVKNGLFVISSEIEADFHLIFLFFQQSVNIGSMRVNH